LTTWSGGAQAQPHHRAATRAFACGHLGALGQGQLAHDVETQADPAEPATVAGLTLHEALEDPLPVGGRDADAGVGHRHLYPVASLGGPDRYRAAVWRVLEGVLDELADDDVGGHRVTVRRGQVIRDLGGQGMPVR
jgi:hypothetical protein